MFLHVILVQTSIQEYALHVLIVSSYMTNKVCVHAVDKLALVDFERTGCFEYLLALAEFTFTKKKSYITFFVSFDSFYTVKKLWPAVFVWIQTECQCSILASWSGLYLSKTTRCVSDL